MLALYSSPKKKRSFKPVLMPESSNTANGTAAGNKMKKNTTVSGSGCTAEVSWKVPVPAAIRSLADWEWKKVKVKKMNQTAASTASRPLIPPPSQSKLQRTMEKKEIGTSEQLRIVDSVCSIATARSVSRRGKITINPREREMMEDRQQDRYHDDWRLDIDDLSYEQLLALTDRIGYVTTGLKEAEIGKCISQFKLSVLGELSCQIGTTLGKKCTVCQEEFEGGNELGKLECGHGFHLECIKQWLANKNTCPVCKTEPFARG